MAWATHRRTAAATQSRHRQPARPPHSTQSRPRPIHPDNAALRGAAELSWRIARHRGLLANAADHTDSGLLIDVAELWELFVLHCARRVFGSAHVTHGTRLTNSGALLRAIDNPARTLGRLYPDLVIGPLHHPWAIVDAKYKRLIDPVGVVREDLYQINAHLGTHTSAPLPLGMLAYVEFPGQPLPREQKDSAHGPPPSATQSDSNACRSPKTAALQHYSSWFGVHPTMRRADKSCCQVLSAAASSRSPVGHDVARWATILFK
ncbi:5-methylcytosine restriction system specificity protein McrC [Nocardia rhizosphaerihabitans]|uniref:McrBC 5-methylcytosine restriction system component n=1 Tax=Nocardia rhizosphaerihabitans TaxID=1691570 RepID=A0ABQ2K374_9NOCA|nr:hypothetical protein GCM10011610_01230 [Nocardia rhizosphaerihabitans]